MPALSLFCQWAFKSELPWAKYLVLAPDDETVEIDVIMIVS